MSSPDRVRPVARAAALALALSAALLSGCTVRPLYSDTPTSSVSGATMTQELSSILVKPVGTRYAQEVRNHLIFLLGNGAGQPADARYAMDLNVSGLNESAAEVQVTSEDDEPTAGTITLTAAYVLTDMGTGERIASGTRQISSSYDRPRQEFATLRAERDAEDRAARELAELLKLSLAQDFVKR